ncbi:MAG: N-acetylmuramoyl-L-alanine amidase [Gemmatimonadales bacterium]
MIGLLLALAVAAPPMALVVSGPRGDVRIPVRSDPAGPLVPAPTLLQALGAKGGVAGAWAELEIAAIPFRLLIDAPFYSTGSVIKPLVGAATVKRDTLFLPIDFVTAVIPAELKERFRYSASAGRLEDLTGQRLATAEPRTSGPAPVVLPGSSAPRSSGGPVVAASTGRTPSGLNKGHVVVVDPGHGGVDPGNPGIFFPRGVREKDVALKVGLLLREELRKRGVGVIMTRTTDTLIALQDRAPFCTDECGLFVSLHVNSLPKRAGYTKVRGFETYFLADAKSEDAARVAKMENEAIRFETGGGSAERLGGLDFILKDLQLNEYLRESGRLAELMQSHLGEVHSGPNRGVKQTSLWVLNTARRPAVLVEMGYSTNPDDARVMTDPRSQRNLAGAIADAVVAYLIEFQQRVGESGTAGGRE